MEAIKSRWTKIQESREHFLDGPFIMHMNSHLVFIWEQVMKTYGAFRYCEYVCTFSAQAECGRAMGNEAGKEMEVVGEVQMPNSLICYEMFSVAKESYWGIFNS